MNNQIVLNNLLINYYDFSSLSQKNNLTLIFLHGWRSEGMVWQTLIKNLKKNFPQWQIFALDLPGFGKSQPPQSNFNLQDYCNFLEDFIIKLDLKNIILIGHSFGGRIAIKLASQKAELINKLVLIDSAGLIEKPKKKQVYKILAKIVKPFFSPSFMQSARKKIYQRIGSEDYLATPNLGKTYLNIINEDLSLYLLKIQKPTLIIWGEQDKETPLALGEKIHREIKNSKFIVLKNAGHFSFLDQPNDFFKQLIEFLKQ